MPGLARRSLLRVSLWLLVPLCAAVAASSVDSAHAGRSRLVRAEEKAVEINTAVGKQAEVADSERQGSEDVVFAAVTPDGAVEGRSFKDQELLAAPSTFRDLVNEDDNVAEMLEEKEVVGASVDMEHSLARLGRSTVYHGVNDYALKFCAKQGENCTCDGIVGYGNGKTRVFERVTGVTACVGASFAEEPGTTANDCLCYNLDWCQNGGRNVTDKAHRRRSHAGIKGEQSYQRRRWCGWGPRDCQWGEWGSWSECEGECGSGVQKRERSQASPAVNGGHCKDESVGTRPCTLASCSHHAAKAASHAGGGASTPHQDKTAAEGCKHAVAGNSTAAKKSTEAKVVEEKKHVAAHKTARKRHVEGSAKHKKATVAAKAIPHHKKATVIATEV